MASDDAALPAEHWPKGRLGTAADVPKAGQTSKVRLVTMEDLDRRTKAAQIALETKSAIMAALAARISCPHLSASWRRTLPCRRPCSGTRMSGGCKASLSR
jgi:hypothetical protein